MAHQLQWLFRVNEKIRATPAVGVWPPSYTADNHARAGVWHIKESLIGSGNWTDAEGIAAASSNNWIVRGSGSGSGAFGNNDGVDRWPTSLGLVNGAGANPKSWIVLAQPKIADNFEVCISYDTGSYSTLSVIVSPNKRFGAVGGGVNGSNTARPTALDEIVVLNATTCGIGTWINGQYSMHVLRSSDGTATRIFMTRTGFLVGYWAFEKPTNPPTGWQHPSVSYVYGTNTTNQTSAYPEEQAFYKGAAGGNFRGRSKDYPNGAAFAAYAGQVSGWGFMREANWVANESDGSIPFYANMLADNTTMRGRSTYGALADFYYVPSNFGTGSADVDREWVVVWPIVLPWNKTIPIFY